MPKIILASNSPYRATLLSQLGIPFASVTPDYKEESPNCSKQPAALAQKFAEAKAESLQNRYHSHLIIGSDQVATVDSNILQKPATRYNAIQQLLNCSGKVAVFYTAIVLLNSKNRQVQRACTKTRVTFRALNKQETERYIDKENPLDCCGSFKIEGLGISLMHAVESDDPSALIGLPLIALANMLRAENIVIP